MRERINAKLLYPVLFLRYPDYNDPVGELIHEFLHGTFDINAETQFILYALNMVKDMGSVMRALQKGRIVLADRYLTTTLAYQGLKGFPLEKGLKFAELFKMAVPDIAFFLKASPEICMQRKKKEKIDLDRHEKDLEFMGKIDKEYEKLINDNVFAKKWVIIDGEKSKQEITNEIISILNKEFNLNI